MINISAEVKQAWQCPNCKTVYAPHIDKCECAKFAGIGPEMSETKYFGPTTIPRPRVGQFPIGVMPK